MVGDPEWVFIPVVLMVGGVALIVSGVDDWTWWRIGTGVAAATSSVATVFVVNRDYGATCRETDD